MQQQQYFSFQLPFTYVDLLNCYVDMPILDWRIK